MKKLKLLLGILALVFLGCASSVNTTITGKARSPLPDTAQLMVLQTYQKQPDSCIKIGEFTIGDNGFTTDCSYNKVMEAAKALVRKAGGNILNIETFSAPGGLSTCYRMRADILYRPNLNLLLAKINAVQDSITRLKFNGATNYAIVDVYRPASPGGSLIGYNLRVKDSVICRAKNGCRAQVRLNKEGKTTIWAETETRDSVTINVKFGQEYFLKCGVQLGAVVGEPILMLMDKPTGRLEYDAVK